MVFEFFKHVSEEEYRSKQVIKITQNKGFKTVTFPSGVGYFQWLKISVIFEVRWLIFNFCMLLELQ